MQRRAFFLSLTLIAAVAGVVGAVLLLRPANTRTVTVKALLPKADAKLVVDGKEIQGAGVERTLDITARHDTIVVATTWQPNEEWTRVRRTRIDLTHGSAPFVADLRRPSPVYPDETIYALKILVPQEDAQVWIDGVP